MKFIVIALAACVVICAANPVSDEHKEKCKKAKAECITDTGVGEDVVKNAKESGEFADDPKLAEFFTCFFKKLGFMNEAGEFQVKELKTRVTEKHGEEFAEKYLAECTKKTHDDINENALNMAKCYHKHAPKHED